MPLKGCHNPSAASFPALHLACTRPPRAQCITQLSGAPSIYCRCAQLPGCIPVDFLIRECAECALVLLVRPKEERLLSCFLRVEEAAETHRWVGLLHCSSFLQHLALHSLLTGASEQGGAKRKQRSTWTQLCAVINVRDL